MRARQAGDEVQGFFLGHACEQWFGTLGTQSVNRTQILAEHLAIDEEKGAEGLVLGGGEDVFLLTGDGFGCTISSPSDLHSNHIAR
jgi:hypothetical protein